MKIGEYEQMMAYLTRPGFNGGGSGKKQTTIKDLKDSGKIVTGDKYKPSNPKLIQAIRDFELRNPRKKNDEGGPQIVEPPKSMQVDTTTSSPIPEYNLNDFKKRADLLIKGALGGFPKDEMINKLQIELNKVQESGTLSKEEAINFINERTQQLREYIKQNPGETLPELDVRENFSKGGVAEYLSNLKPGSVVNTYELGKKFNVAPATVRGQIERNFPQLKLQTIEEGAAKAKETRRAQYAEKTSDVPIIQSEVKGKGAEARIKGRNIIGVKFPNEELENKYIRYMEDRYSDVKGRKGPSNKELAIEFYGDASKANVAKIEKINQYYKKNLDLKFEKAPPDEVKEKRKRRLDIVQGGKKFTGTDEIPFHHIMPIGGEVDLTTKDVAFINKQMNSKLAPYNTKLNDIADAISNQLNNQEPGYLKRIDQLNKQAEQIVESAKLRLPKKFQNYIGFNRLDPILDEYGTPIRMNVTRVGVDDSKSLAGKRGEAVKLETLTQKKLLDKIKKSGKVGAAGVLAAAVPSTFALADDRLAGEQPVEGMREGLPYEAALPSAFILGKYGPQVLNLLKNIGVKPFGSVTAGLGYTASELASEDPSYGLAGAEMLLPEVTGAASKAANIQSKFGRFLLNPFTVISPSAATVVPKIMTRVGVPVMIGGGIMDIAKASQPDFLLDKETGEPMAFDREDASFVMPTMIDANEQVSRFAKEKGISYQDAFQELFKDKTFREGIQETVQKYAIGGRANFADGPEDPGKRKFMKIMGGLASLPIVGRFFDVAQVAEKAAPAVVETFKNAPPHFIGLVNKIKALGKVVDPKNLMPDEQKRFSNVYDYGDYRMFESKDGQIEISKENLMATDYGDGIVSEEYMSYNPKSPKINKKGEIEGYEDEYNEYTAYADEDGKMKDVQDGIEESTKDDGIYSKEELEQLIIEQVEQNLKKGKK